MFHIQLEKFQDSYFPKSHDFILPLTKAVIESFQNSDVLPTTKQIYEDLEKLYTKKESLIEKLYQSRQEQDRLYQYKKNYDNYLGKEVER